MDNFDSVSSHLAIRLCVGCSENGRARHRTINIKNIDPNVDISMLAAFVRDTIAPLLAYPITGARLVTKKVRVLFDADHKKAEPREPEPVVTPAAQGEHAVSEAAIHKVEDTKRGRKFQRANVVAAQFKSVNRKISVVAPFCYTQNTTGEFFEDWFKNKLVKSVPKGVTIISEFLERAICDYFNSNYY